MTSEGTVRKIDSTIKPDRIQSIADDAIADAKKRLDEIAKTPEGEINIDTLRNFEEVLGLTLERITPLVFMKYVSTDKEQRDVCDEVEKQAQKFKNELWGRKDLFEVIVQLEPLLDSLDTEDKTLLEKTLDEFRHRGASLDENRRMEFLEIANNISVLESDFNRVLNEITTTVPFTEEELEGVPPSIYEDIKKIEGIYNLPLDYPISVPVIYYAKNPESRKRMQLAVYSKGGKENSERLQDALSLRERQAKLVGHSTFAEYEIKRKMAKTPQRVIDFMNDLKTKLTPLSEKEFEVLKELKSKELDIPIEAVVLESWDLFYYHEMLMREKYAVDQNEVKKYFPIDLVIEGALNVYQTVLNYEFREEKNPDIWHEDVREFHVFDKATGNMMGVFYLDLYPREGKFKHYAVFPILERRVIDGVTYLPITSQVSNFQKPTKSQPSLLTHDNVITYFHEFGHLMHVISNNTRYSRFGLDGVLPDFIEVPSKMFENWAWEEEVLSNLSGHFEDKKKKLPNEMLKSMIDAKLLNIGTFQLRQVFYSLIDMLFHTEGAEDTTSEWRRLFKEITRIEIPEGTFPDAGFGHIMGSYAAGYYSYTWSQVYAEDLFTKFKKSGFMDEKTGLAYRTKVLAPGGSKDPDEMVREFLGRDSNNEAFLKSLGIDN